MAAHVTLLFPFLPIPQIDHATRVQLRARFASLQPLSMHFDRVARFPDVAYLALAEPAPVIETIRALAAAWPDCPPYEGRFADVVPHLTIAHGDEQVLAAVERVVASSLPITAHAHEATLLTEDDTGRWHEKGRFTLGTIEQ
jgi:2'-5' RNA ligase